MKSRKLIASILLWLVAGLVSTAVHALEVRITLIDANGNTIFDPATGEPVFQTTLTGAATVNLDADSPVGGAKAYGPFTISKCANCPGRARVFVSDSDIDRLVLTDAQITNTSGATARLRIEMFSGELTVSGPAGDYPYAVELSGSFIAPLGQSATTPTGNEIRVTGRACWGESCTPIDSPVADPGEVVEGPNFSIVAPPYLVAGSANYAPKENQNIFCSGFFGEFEESSCLPSLSTTVDVTLRAGHRARLPGSIGTFHVGERCEPESNPPLLEGCEKMAKLFASLGPKGFEVYEFRMEPSPGTERTFDFRLMAENSPDPWRTHRGEPREGQSNEGNNTSSTVVTLDSGGGGEVRAKGLCPMSGCLAAGAALPVRLFCGQEARHTTTLVLDGKGDGRAHLAFGLPCFDPGVLIMDPDDNYWVAAPLIK